MEDDHAGLDLIKWIRESHKNTTTRLILRTGQPGQAPEEDVIRDYDINDYKNKTELNSTRLKTTIYAAIRSYRDIKQIEQSHAGLQAVVDATTRVLRADTSDAFSAQVIQEVETLLDQAGLSFYLHYQQLNALQIREHIQVSTDGTQHCIETAPDADIMPTLVRADMDKALVLKDDISRSHLFCSYTALSASSECVACVSLQQAISPLLQRLLSVMLTKVSIVFESLTRREDIERTQQELMFVLGDAIEQRSKETGSHVLRVSLIAEFLARHLGLDEGFIRLIKHATPMHDIGKIAIPEHILHKPAKLDAQEWLTMQTHAQAGYDLLSHSKRALLQVGARIALFHHEKWDGSGYPSGLAGEDIPIEGRIMAIADVIDALAARRVYKEPWSAERILALLEQERGQHFDPTICDVAIKHFNEIMALRDAFPD